MSDLDAIVQALRAERETSPWWTQHAERRDPIETADLPHISTDQEAEGIWDDSETTTARRRRLLDEAARGMHEEATG